MAKLTVVAHTFDSSSLEAEGRRQMSWSPGGCQELWSLGDQSMVTVSPRELAGFGGLHLAGGEVRVGAKV